MPRREPAPQRGAPEAPRLSSLLSIEVTLLPPPGAPTPGLFAASERPVAGTVSKFHADPGQMQRATEALQQFGFRVVSRSRLSISLEGAPDLFTKVFGTKLAVRSLAERAVQARPAAMDFLAPAPEAKWEPPDPLKGLVERAYIQQPFLYFEKPLPPRVGYHHLRAPGDVAILTNAAKVHRAGHTGRGVKVAMIDSGFYLEHPYYQLGGYNAARMLAPGATNLEADEVGHGTAEMANILATAPDVTFIGIKTGPNLTAAFKETVKQNPDIISISLGWDLRGDDDLPRPTLPGFLRALEAEIADAVDSGVVVVVSAGNGHISFPGMHPDVISAGGTWIDEGMSLIASDYASAFRSVIYPGRSCPDLTGLVGMKPAAAYIMLPLQPGCSIDQDVAGGDGTAPDDGWSVISGTSAAAPQLAGVCALLKQKSPGIAPQDLKAVLTRTARDVTHGHANEAANPTIVEGQLVHVPLQAAQGPDGATGHGLVDAFAAWQQV